MPSKLKRVGALVEAEEGTMRILLVSNTPRCRPGLGVNPPAPGGPEVNNVQSNDS
jgi:hypothetical protein